jgi:hypothetical protein
MLINQDLYRAHQVDIE